MNSTNISAKGGLPDTKLTFRLLCQGEIALGPGKIELLLAIDRTGSISAAGKAMNMSYRRAWMLVDVMNRCFTQPLVLTAKGGQHGGGTILTPFGRQVVDNYLQITTALNHTMTAYLPLFSGLVREQCLMDGKDATNPISE